MLGGAEAHLDLAVLRRRRTCPDRWFLPGGQARLRRHDDRDKPATGDGDVRRDEARPTVSEPGGRAASERAQTAEATVLSPAPLFRSTVPSYSRGHDLHLYYRARPEALLEQRSGNHALLAERARHGLGARATAPLHELEFLRFPAPIPCRRRFAVRADHHDCAGEQQPSAVGDGHAVILAEAVPAECRRGHDVFGTLGAAEALWSEQILRDTQRAPARALGPKVRAHSSRAHQCVHGWKDVQQLTDLPHGTVAADHPRSPPVGSEGRGRGSEQQVAHRRY